MLYGTGWRKEYYQTSRRHAGKAFFLMNGGEIGEMGILGAPLKGYGCPGLSYTAYGLICQELERGIAAYARLLAFKGLLLCTNLGLWQRRTEGAIPAKMASGELVGCFGI